MATKIDNERLGQYIGELNSLQSEWGTYQKRPLDQGDNGGGTITQMVELMNTLQKIQDAFDVLIGNTVSYMEQRKASVEAKDAEAIIVVLNN